MFTEQYEQRLTEASQIASEIAAALPAGYDLLADTCARGYPHGFERVVAAIDPDDHEAQYQRMLDALMEQHPALTTSLLALDEEVGALLALFTEGDEANEWKGKKANKIISRSSCGQCQNYAHSLRH